MWWLPLEETLLKADKCLEARSSSGLACADEGVSGGTGVQSDELEFGESESTVVELEDESGSRCSRAAALLASLSTTIASGEARGVTCVVDRLEATRCPNCSSCGVARTEPPGCGVRERVALAIERLCSRFRAPPSAPETRVDSGAGELELRSRFGADSGGGGDTFSSGFALLLDGGDSVPNAAGESRSSNGLSS